METTVSAPSPVDAAGGGRSNGVCGPPFPLTSSTSTCTSSADVGTPRDFLAPDTCDGNGTAGSGTLKPDIGSPPRCARSMPHSRGTAVLNFHFNYKVLLVPSVLSFNCVVLLVLSRGCSLPSPTPSPRL